MSVCLDFVFFIDLPPNVITKFHVSLYPLASAQVLWIVIENLAIIFH